MQCQGMVDYTLHWRLRDRHGSHSEAIDVAAMLCWGGVMLDGDRRRAPEQPCSGEPWMAVDGQGLAICGLAAALWQGQSCEATGWCVETRQSGRAWENDAELRPGEVQYGRHDEALVCDINEFPPCAG